MDKDLFQAKVEALKIAAALSEYEGEDSSPQAIIYNASIYEMYLTGQIKVTIVEPQEKTDTVEEDGVIKVDFTGKH